jgi:hypothetical protein
MYLSRIICDYDKICEMEKTWSFTHDSLVATMTSRSMFELGLCQKQNVF